MSQTACSTSTPPQGPNPHDPHLIAIPHVQWYPLSLPQQTYTLTAAATRQVNNNSGLNSGAVCSAVLATPHHTVTQDKDYLTAPNTIAMLSNNSFGALVQKATLVPRDAVGLDDVTV